MEYSKLTSSNKNFLKRFSHKKRFLVASKLIEKYNPYTFLDYGTGDGEIIKYLHNVSKKKICLFEPVEKMRENLNVNIKNFSNIKIFEKSEEINKNFFDLISINEVFEHLTLEECKKTLNILKQAGKQNVKLIISVPIEVGLSSLLKNLIRILTNQTHQGTNLKNLIKSVFYFHIDRPNIPYNDSHIGFNYKKFIQFLIVEGIIINKITYSPFNLFKGIANTQIFIEANFND